MREGSKSLSARIGWFLRAPVFEENEDKTRVARLLNTILLAFLAVVLVLGCIIPLSSDDILSSMVALGVTASLVFGALLLMRAGYVRLASGLFSSGMLVFDTALLLVSGGVNNPLAATYLVAVTMAGLLMGGRAAILFAGVGAAAGIGLFYVESGGFLPETIISVSPITGVMALGGTLALISALLYLATQSINEALARARRNERDLAQSNRELLAVRASLESHNDRLRAAVRQYGEYLADVGQGNLSSRLSLSKNGHNEVDEPLIALGRRLNETIASLQAMIAQVRDAGSNINSAAAEILAATTQQASGANEQSAAIAQTTTTVDEVKVIAEQSMKRSQEVAGISERTVRIARAGQQAVQETITSMAQIKERVEGIAENILALSEQTQQIGEIIATVNDIAAQSNMLALNASVEAARAGEHGKGFSVVAVEVRNLAEQSRQATAQVKAILSDIQRATNATVMATEEGTKGVDVGVRLAGEAREAIGRLSTAIEESAQAALQMVAGGQQQASGIEQIALAMANINQATVQSLASTRQAEQAAQNLNELARSLSRSVEQYQL